MPSLESAPTPRNQYSFSRIKTLHQCPLRYRYRYLKGFKELFRSIESFLGSAVHDVLEWLYTERDNASSPSLDAALDELDARWSAGLDENVTVIRVADRPDDYLLTAREMVERFHRGAFQRDESTTVGLEQRLSHSWPDGLVFTGFADRIGRTDQGRLFVIDYKTSKTEGNPTEFSEGLQAPLYAACLMQQTDDDEALAGYHYLRHDTTRWQPVDRERAGAVLTRIKQLADEAEATAEFPARPGVLCSWCGFNAICPSAEVPAALSGGVDRAREILDRTPGLFDS